MSAKGKIPPESKPKLSKKAQKAAKQEEKNKESQSKPEKKEFTELSGILSKKRIEFMGQKYIQIKNKTVQEYAEEAVSRWSKQNVEMVAFGKAIPKAITVIEIFKRKIGVYDQREFKVDQKTVIFKDEDGDAIVEIVMIRP